MNDGLPPAPGFTHLHVHSHFTLLGGTAPVEALVRRAAADGMRHLALTDTNALYGAVAFSRACQAAGIEPILGMAATVAPLPNAAPANPAPPGLLVLLAKNPTGYRSLCRLSSLIQAHPDRAERAARGLDWDTLAANRQGLICLSGGRRGWIQRLLRAGDPIAASQVTARLAGIFGDDAFLAVEWHGPGDEGMVSQVTAIGRRFGIPTVAAQPVYCLEPEERSRLSLLAAIDRNCRVDEVPAEALPAAPGEAVDLHWLAPGEVRRRLAQFTDALAAVPAVVNRCGPALPDGSPIWPALKLPEGQTPDQALADLAGAGLAARFQQDAAGRAAKRLQRELDAIAGHGYSSLFLVVADIVQFARAQEIPVSTRGSVANSLVAYCAGITTVDPVHHNLLFERFLSPARGPGSAPDIDLDFCSRRRDRVLEYVRATYGADNVALVATVSTMRLKSAIRETGKALGLAERAIGQLVKRLPRGWHPDPRRRSRRTIDDVLRELPQVSSDPHTLDLLRTVVHEAVALEGQPHHLSIHPGGIVITPGPLTDVLPLQWTAKGYLITQYGHEDVEAIGLPKIDLLGIRALTVLADAAELVRRHHDPGFRLAAIALNDPVTGDLLARGETVGVFQCESTGARRTLRQLKARTVQDLAVANAFFKPGPATGGMARTFIRRYRGEAPVAYLHPSLEPILGITKGVLIFQEQVLRVATEIAGLDWEQADHLRKGMSKFQPEEMAAMRNAFVAGCLRPAPSGPAFSPQQAETLWEQVLAFAGYGFNQGHATAYADVSFRSAYLKAHWPAEFFCARLSDWGGFHHPAVYMAEAVRMGIGVRPPHVNHSDRKFSLQQSPTGSATLWMGLGQVRDLRRSAIHAIVAQRRQRPFADLSDLLNRVPLQPKEAMHLIQCGALDGLAASRAGLLAQFDQVRRAGTARQMAFDFAAPAVTPESAAQRLAWEMHLLGQPVAVHPLDLVAAPLVDALPLADLPRHRGQPVTTAGVRLPGWTGGEGFYLGDGTTFIVCTPPANQKAPAPWTPLRVEGRWRHDEWGGGWLEATTWEELPVDSPGD